MNLSFILSWLLFSSLILTSDTIKVFNFNSTNPTPFIHGDSGKRVAKCNDTSGCEFNCRGQNSCYSTEFYCADNAPCNLFCMLDGKGQSPCGRSHVNCSTAAHCEISVTGSQAMYGANIYAQSSSSLRITAQGDESLDNVQFYCPKHGDSPPKPNCVVRLIAKQGEDVKSGILSVVPAFFIDNLSDLKFECTGVNETDYYKLFSYYDDDIGSLNINYQNVTYRMKYEPDGLNCTSNNSFSLTHNKCETFTNSTLSPSIAPSNAPTTITSVPTSIPTSAVKKDEDKSIATWKLTLILIAVVIALVLIAAFVGFKYYQSRDAQNNDGSGQYEQAHLFEESDGDDSLMMVVKNSLNEQQQQQ